MMNKKNHSGAVRALYIALGLLCVALGAVGVALPILPHNTLSAGGGLLLCKKL